MGFALRYYVYECDGVWHAICSDLNIAVGGGSAREAEESLETAIELYLETVAELPAGEHRRFLARRAPWHVRFRLAAAARLRGLRGADTGVRRFVFEAPTFGPSGETPVPASRTAA